MADARLHHISDQDFERYTLDMMPEPEMIIIEEHLLGCHDCLVRLEAVEYIENARRQAADPVRGFDKDA
jgi:hypothetical protein